MDSICDAAGDRAAVGKGDGYVELLAASNFSFLRGASHPEELVERAAALGYRAVAITDRHTLAGIVRAHVAAKQHGLRLLVGTRIALGIDDCAHAGTDHGAAADAHEIEPEAIPHADPAVDWAADATNDE